jgi:hypothetical protein
MREGRRLLHDILTLSSHTNDSKTRPTRPPNHRQDQTAMTPSSSGRLAVNTQDERAGAARGGFVRDRTHRFPGRRHALKVLYDDLEVVSVRAAAQLAGLTPTGNPLKP